MQINLQANQSTELSFRVGIAGTQQLPASVQVILEREGRSLSFAATSTAEGWTAVVNNPGQTFGDGQVNFMISVVLANRTFTPLRGTAIIVPSVASPSSVTSTEPVAQPVEAPVAPVNPPEIEVVPTVQAVQVEAKVAVPLMKLMEPAQPKAKPVVKPAPKAEIKTEQFSGLKLTRTKIVTM